MADTCTLTATDPRSNGPDTPLIPCDEPTVCVITFACLHEHFHPQPACAGCAVEIQMCAGILICPRCEDGPEPHECPCDVRITWQDGSTTVVQEITPTR
jgi:hypothetical protein